MLKDRSEWLGAVKTGLVWGGVAVFLALVGMVGTFAERQVIAGVLSLGHTVLYLTVLTAGFLAARRLPPMTALLRGGLAGLAWGAIVAAFACVSYLVNLRAMFINVSPEVSALLAFGRGVPGTSLQLLAGAAAGVLGAVVHLVSPGVRRPVGAGLAWVLFAGLFQELFRLMLSEGDVRAAIGSFLFTDNGVTVTASVVLFLVGAAGSAVLVRRRAVAASRQAPVSAARQRTQRWILLAAGLVGLLLAPVAGGLFLSQVLVLVGLYVLLGLGLNIVVGFAGLLDLGFVAFFAIGAYTVGLLTTTGPLAVLHLNFWEAVPFAVIVALAAGVVLGLPILRIRGDYLAIATLGFGEIIRLLVLSDFFRPWLGGSQGVLGIPKPTIGAFEFRGPEQLIYLTIVASALVAFVAVRLRDSRLGRAWMATREDEDVAEAMGVNLVNVKLLAYGLGAAFGGMSGAVFAVMVGSVFPHSFNLIISVNVLAVIIVGGMGSLPGVAVGSLFLVGLPELLREFSEFRFLIYGAALIIMMQLKPEGLWPEAVRRRELHETGPETPAASAGALASPGSQGEP
jgi:branched-chain amino acid transport system permease protein